jgi:prepilin-type N-terminal cleavage/methylation domain-containing protein
MKPSVSRPEPAARLFSAPQRGFTLIEVITVIAIVGILARVAYSYIDPTRLHIGAAQLQVMSQLRIARTKAITSVSHYSVQFSSSTQLTVYPMTYNGTAWQLATSPISTVTLPSSVTFATGVAGTGVEFNSRGMVVGTSGVLQLNLQDTFSVTKSLQVWPSGQINAL